MSSAESQEELTRKQRREQARANRRALEEAHAANAARRRRLIQLAGVAAAVVIALVVILLATGGGGKAKVVKAGSGEASQTTAAVSSLIGGIPQSANVLGSPSAPVTLEYFGDLQCPICKQFTLGALPTIIQKWVRPGKLRIEYRSLETATHEPEVFKTQQAAALAAGKQQKMWNYMETFYHEQQEENSGYVTEGFLQGIASQVPGLNLAQWTSDRSEPTYANQIAADAQTANNVGFNGTPSFLIGRSGATMKKFEYSSLTDPTTFNEAIEAQLKG